MLVYKYKTLLSAHINTLKKNHQTIGFVPTMGALHRGHLSLVELSKAQNDFTVVSIFVNPTQFNDKNDLSNYPRTMESDVAMLEKMQCDAVYAPDATDIYPEKDERIFSFDGLDRVMEGRYREGHFNGVAQVVSKLFDIVNPNKAYFGQKDFQQVAIVNYLTKKILKRTDIEIVTCPIVREPHGLAMSSRNELLTAPQRQNAANIYAILQKAVAMKVAHTVQEVKQWVCQEIDKNEYLKTEYFEIVDNEQLQPCNTWQSEQDLYGCIAVFCGKVRLIDNIKF